MADSHPSHNVEANISVVQDQMSVSSVRTTPRLQPLTIDEDADCAPKRRSVTHAWWDTERKPKVHTTKPGIPRRASQSNRSVQPMTSVKEGSGLPRVSTVFSCVHLSCSLSF